MCIAMLLWGRLLLKKVPKTAIAKPGVVAMSKADEVENGSDDVMVMGVGTTDVELCDVISRDIFAFRADYYQQVERVGSKVVAVQKSTLNKADEHDEKEMIRIQARSLVLQSTMRGQQSRAMINGQMLCAGEIIQGFELVKILSRKAVLRKDGVEVVLEM